MSLNKKDEGLDYKPLKIDINTSKEFLDSIPDLVLLKSILEFNVSLMIDLESNGDFHDRLSLILGFDIRTNFKGDESMKRVVKNSVLRIIEWIVEENNNNEETKN